MVNELNEWYLNSLLAQLNASFIYNFETVKEEMLCGFCIMAATA